MNLKNPKLFLIIIASALATNFSAYASDLDIYVMNWNGAYISKTTFDGTNATSPSSYYSTGEANGLGYNFDGTVYYWAPRSSQLMAIAPGGTNATPLWDYGTLGGGGGIPYGIAVDPFGSIYGLGPGNVVKSAANGSNSQVYADQSQLGYGELKNGVFDAAGNLYATDIAKGNLIKIAAGGASMSILTSGLDYASGLAIDSTGNFFVSSYTDIADGRGSIYRISSDGQTISTFASGLNRPEGLVYDKEHDLLIVNEFNSDQLDVYSGLSGTNAGNLNTTLTGYAGPYFIATTPAFQSVPEPSTYALFGLGALGLVVVARRKRA